MMSKKEEDIGSTKTGEQESRIQDIQEYRQDKRNAKRQMTHLLNKLATMLSEDDSIPKTEIKDMLYKIEEQQDHTITAINRSESFYRQKNEEALAEKVSDEVDDLLEQIDHEMRPARLLLASRTKVKSRPSSVPDSEASQRRKEKEKAEVEVRLRRDQFEWEIEQRDGNIISVEDHEATLEIRVGKESVFLCTGNHSLKKCETFKKQSIDGRWQTVKRFGLCFRCLADNHHRKSCPLRKQCGINGCKGTHQNLLHYDKAPTAQPPLRPEAESYVQPLTTPINSNDRPRLCPLGWTAIGKIQLDTKDNHYTGFHNTFCLQIDRERVLSL